MSTAEVLSPVSALVHSHQAKQNVSAHLEIFAVPNARIVQGQTFPVGLEPESNTTPSLEEVISTVGELSKGGVIRELLNQRKIPTYGLRH